MSSRSSSRAAAPATPSSWTTSARTRWPGSEAIEAAGAYLLFIPPYSPDLNPIEMAFAKLKALLRAKAIRTVDALWNELGSLVTASPQQNAPTSSATHGYFQSA